MTSTIEPKIETSPAVPPHTPVARIENRDNDKCDSILNSLSKKEISRHGFAHQSATGTLGHVSYSMLSQ
jgi:hypothetical protein